RLFDSAAVVEAAPAPVAAPPAPIAAPQLDLFGAPRSDASKG
ncbi:MAG: hypothetical protein H6Q89_4225, partial [Myxococcaceae bacterium]|nr:hypothetical protein [Myxococcaceae bacterium]